MAIDGGAVTEARAQSSVVATGLATAGATALKQDVATEVDEAMARLGFAAAGTAQAAAPAPKALDKREEARMKGYVGEACPECANFRSEEHT